MTVSVPPRTVVAPVYVASDDKVKTPLPSLEREPCPMTNPAIVVVALVPPIRKVAPATRTKVEPPAPDREPMVSEAAAR